MKTIWMLFIAIFGLLSCSNSDEPSADTDIIGLWKGTLAQPEFGELITNISIQNTTINGTSGSGSFTSGDLSVCDDSQFNCGPLACTFNLSLLSTAGSTFFEFDQQLIEVNSTCGDGIFEMTVINENETSVKWYQEAFPDNIARGTLTKQ